MTQHFEPPTNAELIHVLQLARQRIESRQSIYICNALYCVSRDSNHLHREESIYLQNFINYEIGCAPSMTDWLRLHRDRSGVWFSITEAAEYKMRLCWIDRMIDNLTNYNNLKGPEV
jgi:hypothetical protein